MPKYTLERERKCSHSAKRNAPPASENITGYWLERMCISSTLEDRGASNLGLINGKRTMCDFSFIHLISILTALDNELKSVKAQALNFH